MPLNSSSPEAVRAACARRCWDDDCDDTSRVLLEIAADTMGGLMTRTGTLAKRNETLEAEVALLRRICYGSQKGGSA